MKRRVLFLSVTIIAVVVFAFAGCDMFGNDGGGDSFSAPEVTSPEELPDTSATSEPKTESEALELFLAVDKAWYNEFVGSASTSTRNVTTSSKSITNTETDTTDLDQSVDYGGGTVEISGEVVKEITEPKEDSQPEPSTTYNDIINYVIDLNQNGTIDSVTIPNVNGTEEYTVSGKNIIDSKTSINYDVVTGSNGAIEKTDIDFSLEMRYGYSCSIKRQSDGMGAKYVVTYAEKVNVSDYEIDSLEEHDSEDMENLFNEIQTKLNNIEVKIKVYNDNNEEIGSYNVSLSEFSGTNLESIY